MKLTEDVAARFIEKLALHSSDECWEWQACRANGYGQLSVNGEMIRAHRIAWLFWRGEIPYGLCVCHICDNKLCCNPRHLWLGSHAANMRDMVAKGRQAHGETVGGARLTADQVREIFKRYKAGGITQKALAAEYGVVQSHISYIATRTTWRHVLAAR